MILLDRLGISYIMLHLCFILSCCSNCRSLVCGLSGVLMLCFFMALWISLVTPQIYGSVTMAGILRISRFLRVSFPLPIACVLPFSIRLVLYGLVHIFFLV